jgi:hypothetical protein
MIRDVLVLVTPILFLVDCALVVTWLAKMSIDGIAIPIRFSLRNLMIVMTVIAIQLGLLSAVLIDRAT